VTELFEGTNRSEKICGPLLLKIDTGNTLWR